MPISEEKFKHGYIIGEIMLQIGEIDGVSAHISQGISRCAYQIFISHNNNLVGDFSIFIKYSAKRRSPWRYSFPLDHQTEIDILKQSTDELFLILLNKDNGVVCINYEKLKNILDHHHEETEWVSVRTGYNKGYQISGKDGKLTQSIPRSDFSKNIIACVKSLISDL